MRGNGWLSLSKSRWQRCDRIIGQCAGRSGSCAALDGGAAIIDVKEPLRGSLGAASAERWDEVLRCVQDRVPVSVALGELTDGALPRRLRHLPAVNFAKVGLAGCRSLPDWVARWREALEPLPPLGSPRRRRLRRLATGCCSATA